MIIYMLYNVIMSHTHILYIYYRYHSKSLCTAVRWAASFLSHARSGPSASKTIWWSDAQPGIRPCAWQATTVLCQPTYIYVYILGCEVTWREVMWRDVTWGDVTSCDVTWCEVMWGEVTWRDVTWGEVMWLCHYKLFVTYTHTLLW